MTTLATSPISLAQAAAAASSSAELSSPLTPRVASSTSALQLHARLAMDDELFIMAIDADRDAAASCLGWPASRLVGRNIDSLLPSSLARELRSALARPSHTHDHLLSLVFGGAGATGSTAATMLRFDNVAVAVQVSLAAVAPTGTPTGSLSSSDRLFRSYGYVLSIYETPELHTPVDAEAVAQFVARIGPLMHRAQSLEYDDPQSQTASTAMPNSSRDSLTNWSDAGGNALSRDPSSTNLTMSLRRTPELSLSNDAPRLASLSDSGTTAAASAAAAAAAAVASTTSAPPSTTGSATMLRPRLSAGSSAMNRISRISSARDAAHERDESLSFAHAAASSTATTASTSSTTVAAPAAVVALLQPAVSSSSSTTAVAPGAPAVGALSTSSATVASVAGSGGGSFGSAMSHPGESSSANAGGSSASPLDDELQIISQPLGSNHELVSHRRALMRIGWIAARSHELQSRRYASRGQDERSVAELTALTLEMQELQNFVVSDKTVPVESSKSPVRRHRRRRRHHRESEVSSAANSDHSLPQAATTLIGAASDQSGGLRTVTMPAGGSGGLRTSSASISRRRVRTGRRRHTRRESITAAGGGDHLSLEPASRRSASAGTRPSLRQGSFMDDDVMAIPALILNDPVIRATDEPLTPHSERSRLIKQTAAVEASGVDFGDIKSSSSSTPPLARIDEEPEAVLRAQSVPSSLASRAPATRMQHQRSFNNADSRHGSWIAGATSLHPRSRSRTTTPDSTTLNTAIAAANLAPVAAGNTSGSNGGGNGGSGGGGKRGSSEKSAAGVTLRQRVSTRACIVPLYRAEMVTSNSLAVRRLTSHSVRSNVNWLERYVTALHAAGWHPNVVFMHALVQLPTELWLVMEWCDSSSVSEAMRRLRAPLLEPQIAAVLKHAVAGLLHLRSHSICHGDLKCANIMLTSAGDAKLTDVTFSATLDAPAYREAVRSAPFVAPEVLVGGAVTHASDVWALGVCALEMAYGAPPAALAVVGGVAVPTIAWPDIAATHTAGLAALVRACHVHSVEQRATIDTLRRVNFLSALDADMARRALAALATRCLRAQIASFSGTRSGDTEASSFTNSNNVKEIH